MHCTEPEQTESSTNRYNPCEGSDVSPAELIHPGSRCLVLPDQRATATTGSSISISSSRSSGITLFNTWLVTAPCIHHSDTHLRVTHRGEGMIHAVIHAKVDASADYIAKQHRIVSAYKSSKLKLRLSHNHTYFFVLK